MRAEEWVDDDVAAIAEVEEGVLEHSGGLDARMVLEAPTVVGTERRGRIGPNVRAPATAFAQFDVVDVRGGPPLNSGRSSCCEQ
jgi:hypothetical protein